MEKSSIFKSSQTSPIYHEVQRARKFAGLAVYEDQKVNLERHYQQSGKDIFVGSFTLQQSKTGDYGSFSVWSRDVPTLLPETDEVFFFDGQKPEAERMVGRAQWSQVVAVVGDLMLDTKMFPPRHFVSKFPSSQQLEALRSTD